MSEIRGNQCHSVSKQQIGDGQIAQLHDFPKKTEGGYIYTGFSTEHQARLFTILVSQLRNVKVFFLSYISCFVVDVHMKHAPELQIMRTVYVRVIAVASDCSKYSVSIIYFPTL